MMKDKPHPGVCILVVIAHQEVIICEIGAPEFAWVILVLDSFLNVVIFTFYHFYCSLLILALIFTILEQEQLNSDKSTVIIIEVYVSNMSPEINAAVFQIERRLFIKWDVFGSGHVHNSGSILHELEPPSEVKQG